MNQVRTLRIWDFLGMGLSVVCLVHCLAIPFLLGFLPFLASSLMHHGTTPNHRRLGFDKKSH